MPRGFKVLLPARVRTPGIPEDAGEPILSWGFRTSHEGSPFTAEPVARFLPSCGTPSRLGKTQRARYRALTARGMSHSPRGERRLASRHVTWTRPSASPENRDSGRTDPTGQERPCVTVSTIPKDESNAPPKGHPEAAPKRGPGGSHP
jgi:hypothetical protein